MSRELIEFEKSFWDCAFSWRKLDAALGSRALNALYIWLFAVPILAKILADIPDRVSINFPSMLEPVYFNIGIPFSWKILYLAALFLTAARTLYICFCPLFVRDNKTAFSAISTGATVQQVRSLAADFVKISFPHELPKYYSYHGYALRALLAQYRANYDDVHSSWKQGNNRQLGVGNLLFDSLERVRFKVDSNGNYIFDDIGTSTEPKLSSVSLTLDREQLIKHQCWDLINVQDISNVKLRACISLLVGLSFLLLAWPFLQSVCSVLILFIRS